MCGITWQQTATDVLEVYSIFYFQKTAMHFCNELLFHLSWLGSFSKAFCNWNHSETIWTVTGRTSDVKRMNDLSTCDNTEVSSTWSNHKVFEDEVPAQGKKFSNATSVSETKKNTAWSKINEKRNPYWCSQYCLAWMRGR